MSRKTKSQVVWCDNEKAVIGKKEWRRQCPPGLRPDSVDHMPSEVATEMLCAPKARSTNRERKIWMAARAQGYVSTREPKPLEQKVADRLKRCTWLQVNTWLKRTVAKREESQRQFTRLQRQSEKVKTRSEGCKAEEKSYWAGLLLLASRQMAALDLRAMSLDAFRDALETELGGRLNKG